MWGNPLKSGFPKTTLTLLGLKSSINIHHAKPYPLLLNPQQRDQLSHLCSQMRQSKVRLMTPRDYSSRTRKISPFTIRISRECWSWSSESWILTLGTGTRLMERSWESATMTWSVSLTITLRYRMRASQCLSLREGSRTLSTWHDWNSLDKILSLRISSTM